MLNDAVLNGADPDDEESLATGRASRAGGGPGPGPSRRAIAGALGFVLIGGGVTAFVTASQETGPGDGDDVVFYDDFAQDAALGTFVEGPYAQRWGAYPDGWSDTSGLGTYRPTDVVSVHDGVLDLWLRTVRGGPATAALVPKFRDATGEFYGQTYGRYQIRFKADPAPGYKLVFLLWPDSEKWPGDGEINFPEADLAGDINAFMHYANPDGGQDVFPTSSGFGQWHVATIEWTPGQVRFLLDGVLVGTSTEQVPRKSMHWVLQTETTGGEPPAADVQGHVFVDWIRAQSYPWRE